ADGQKMGKSLGNARDPQLQLNLYGVDALRYYLIRHASFGSDLAYDEDSLVSLANDVLLKGLGNLVQRSCKVCVLFSEGKVPSEVPLISPPTFQLFDLKGLLETFRSCFQVLPSLNDTQGL